MATSSQTPSLLNDMLECGICFEQMTEQPQHIPKVLPCCQQTVCVSCVANLNTCPFCRTDLPLDLQINRTIIQLGDLVRTSKDSGVNKICEFCHTDRKKACLYCKHCNVHICEECGQKHKENGLFKKHTLVKMVRSINICSTHDKPLIIYCVDCNILLCILCYNEESCCANKNKKGLEDIRQEKTQELEKLITKIASQIHLNTQKQNLNEIIQGRLKRIEEEKVTISTHIRKLKALLNKRECDLLQELDKEEQQITKVMETQLADNDNTNDLKSLQECAEAARGVIEQTVLTIPYLKSRVLDTCTSLPHINYILPKEVTFIPEESLNAGWLQMEDTLENAAPPADSENAKPGR